MDHKTDLVQFQSSSGGGASESSRRVRQYLTAPLRARCRFAVGSAVVAAIWSYSTTPVYQGKATVVIEREGPGALDRDKSIPQDISPEYFQTHFELMKSRQVLQRTAQLLISRINPSIKHSPPGSRQLYIPYCLPSSLKSLEPKERTSRISAEEKEDNLLRNFGQQIEIMPIRGARLAHITVNSKDPKFAARAANTLATVYIEGAQELSSSSKEKAARWFTGQLEEARKKVEASQQALYVFRSKHELLGGHQQEAVAAHKITELNSELFKAEIEKARAQTRYEQTEMVLRKRSDNGAINWSNLDAATEVLSSSLIQTLRAQEIRVSGQLAELSDKYGPLHPKMARTQAELQDLRERIQQEVQKIYDSVKREYDGAWPGNTQSVRP